VAQVSELGHAVYRAFWQGVIRATVTQAAADRMRTLNPLRLSYTLFADSNPLIKGVEQLTTEVKSCRRPVAPNNPFLQIQKQVSDQIITALDAYRDTRDRIEEGLFFAIYGSPVVQGMLGLNSNEKIRELPGVSPEMRAAKKARAAAYVVKVRTGGFVEALVRAVLFVTSADRALDERCASALYAARHDLSHLSLEQYKALVRDQFFMLLLERERAFKAIATMVKESDQRAVLLKRVTAIIGADNMSTAVVRERIGHLEKLLATQITNRVPPRAPVRRGVWSEMSATMVTH